MDKIWPVHSLILLLVLLSRITFGLEKHWLPDLEWHTLSNWVDDRVPAIDSRVIFPLETRHAVGIAKSGDLKLAGIELAREGSLVLSRDGKLQLSDRRTDTKFSKWAKEGLFFWADPENWNGSSVAAPHFERVPCREDDVVLPGDNRTFSMRLPINDVQVRSVRTENRKRPFVQWHWEGLSNQREFSRGRFTVKYVDYTCEKCPCQNSESNYLEEICDIEKPRCGFTDCEYPLKVEGHCCRYCGGRVTVRKDAVLPMIRDIAYETLEGYNANLAWHVRRTWSDGIEILLKDKVAYSEPRTIEAVQNLKIMLQEAGIEVLATETAGAALKDSRLAIALGPLFATPLVIFAFLLLIFSYFGYTFVQMLSGCADMWSSIRDGMRKEKSKSDKPFGFARFENVPEGNVEINDVPGTSGQSGSDREEDTSSGGRFENPLYRSKRSHGKVKEEERKILNVEVPLSLSSLQSADHIEEVEMDIEQ